MNNKSDWLWKMGIIGSMILSMSAHASFIANYHENYSAGNNYLYIFGAEDTIGTISGNDGFFQDFTIDDTGVYELQLGSAGREMSGSGTINNFSLLVGSDDPISGIALNRAPFTSDQTNVLDIEGLGSEYLVLTSQDHTAGGSQMSVTAVEDNTTVTITPTISLGGNPAGSPFDVVLQAGESVFYQSSGNQDLSGTKVSSTSDVAVFAGSECTNVPAGVTACDHLISQQLSIDNYGSEFHIVNNFGSGSDGDLIRVIAATDGTEVYLDGVLQGTIDEGEVLTVDNVGDAILTSSEPVMVGQFIRGQSGTRTTGDPAFAIIPSVDQTLDNYSYSTPVGSDAFDLNFLNIAIDTALSDSLMLNGLAVDLSGFDLINDILFGNLEIGEGFGTVSADGSFFASTSGFSNFDSYFNMIATTFSTGASEDPNDDNGVTPVPEPPAIFLMTLGLIGLLRAKKQ